MAAILARAGVRAAQRSAVQQQVMRANSSWAARANPVYPSPWNKWFPHEPVPSTPKVGPYRVRLENTETYFYCTCGESATQPFCESGAEKCTKCPEFASMPFSPKDSETASLCGCKKAPGVYCNGACISLYADLNTGIACLVGFSGCFVSGALLTYMFHP
uniref:Iron-binding zinc finger CDGSH type domain-containing protein n=1 Tax=Alexandrium monilatum TaxID=311494 RepID=A0A7S4QX26_9DINO